MTALATLALLIWIYLVFAHGMFWQAGPVLPMAYPAIGPSVGPSVAIVVPARDEAPVIETTIRSLLAQDYAGPFRVILTDDNSTDGTGDIVRRIGDPRLTVISGVARPAGWSGKLWAVSQGVVEAGDAELVLLTDADIVHEPAHLSCLVAQIEQHGLDLVSEMVKLACESRAERGLVPAFVYFFQLLYPFAWVNDGLKRTAAAAGGTILIRQRALRRIGGVESVRGALIDDVALATAVKKGGRIWLGHADLARSVRPHPAVIDIWRMITRTAFVQLRYSVVLLIATTLGMALVWLVPPVAALFGHGRAFWCGLAAWILLSASYLPTLTRFGRSPLWAPFLPLVACFYMAATIGSAVNHFRGVGVAWKGRAYPGGDGMSETDNLDVETWSGKDRQDENFPVGSVLIARRYRDPIHRFYRFARNADDIADSPILSPQDKLVRLDIMEDVLLGRRETGSPSALALRDSLAKTGLSTQHATDLLIAFRQDATKLRYATIDELYTYCHYSAVPVGRYVLDLHGENHECYSPSDALCMSLQILNHIQDCGKDLAELDRCYLPQVLLDHFGATVADLKLPAETPALRRVFITLLDRVDRMNHAASELPEIVRNRRLRIETGIIHGLAKRLARRLVHNDPLAGRVKLRKTDAVFSSLAAVFYLV